MFGMGETFVLLLSEIDLSIAYVGFVGAMIVAELMASPRLLAVVRGDRGGI